jgi:hypothetical protein
MKQKRDQREIIQDFKLRQSRQFLAIGLALFILILLTLVYKRPDVFGEISRNTVFGAQIIVIAGFVGYSSLNWRCPACKKYLGSNINRYFCKECGTKLR